MWRVCVGACRSLIELVDFVQALCMDSGFHGFIKEDLQLPVSMSIEDSDSEGTSDDDEDNIQFFLRSGSALIR